MTIPMDQRPYHGPFRDLFDKLVRPPAKKPDELGCRALADQLGVKYRTLMYWLEGDRGIPAQYLPSLCKALNNYELLKFIALEANHAVYPLPQIDKLISVEDAKAISRLMKEVSEALEELGKTLEDGIVEKHELDRTIPKLNDVIRECAHLKHWLDARHHADSKIARSKPPKKRSA